MEGPKILLLWRRWRKTRRSMRALEMALGSPERVKERNLHLRIRNLERELADRD